jgi:D-alanyl-D-alanine carboxypeptidase
VTILNKKITPRVIKLICIQSAVLIVAVTILGAAINVHNEYKSTGKSTSVQAEITTVSEVKSTNNSDEMSKNESQTTEKVQTTTQKPNLDYEYAYAGFTPKTITITDDTPLSDILVNGEYVLPEGYEPTIAEAVEGSGVYLDYRVAPFYQAMYDKALEDGITLNPVSGYRSYDLQTSNFENKISYLMDSKGLSRTDATIEAATIIMIPGGSEHNAGLAMDICSLSESFEDTDEFAWLSENAADFGFILRYPKDEESIEITKVTYEPWHYRFVGVSAAKEITAKGITLEEYLQAN